MVRKNILYKIKFFQVDSFAKFKFPFLIGIFYFNTH